MENKTKILTHNLGFPRIGNNRELKVATEQFWQGKISEEELIKVGKQIRVTNWGLQKEKGIDLIPSNDFSFYDQVLDTISLFGCVPKRFGWKPHLHEGMVDLDTYFAMARGVLEKQIQSQEEHVGALEMVKWFDTNYHYLVPEFSSETKFSISSNKIFDEFSEALQYGIRSKPVLIGPISFLHLGKLNLDRDADPTHRYALREKLLWELQPLYVQVIKKLENLGAEWIQLDEPVLVLDLDQTEKRWIREIYHKLREDIGNNIKIIVGTYFDDIGDNADVIVDLPINVIHLDLTRGSTNITEISQSIQQSQNKRLGVSLGIVDGRNIWKINYKRALEAIESTTKIVGRDRVMLAPSCSLIHVPINSQREAGLPDGLKQVISFADDKLSELATLSKLLNLTENQGIVVDNDKLWDTFTHNETRINLDIRQKIANLRTEDFSRKTPFEQRKKLQQLQLKLPLLPTTTIGSFPQTAELRQMRSKFKNGQVDAAEYDKYIKNKISHAIRFQEELGIDVLVHGEYERNDMVEYFGEMIEGFAFTAQGWVQSFGSRYVKPPIIWKDVSRTRPMTIENTTYAQSLTSRPVKGMLTGPLTLLSWSFVRNDQHRRDTAFQLALVVRDEVQELERSGIRVIQVDEPAFREGLPLKIRDRDEYFKWARDAFDLAVSVVHDITQIHTHMCYAEFSDIKDILEKLEADVLSIESSRAKMAFLPELSKRYSHDVGPGVIDIHSPRVPAVQNLVQLIQAAVQILGKDRSWVNPDCGLKTRGEEQVKQMLTNLVQAANLVREKL